jgi:hypothetical protein
MASRGHQAASGVPIWRLVVLVYFANVNYVKGASYRIRLGKSCLIALVRTIVTPVPMRESALVIAVEPVRMPSPAIITTEVIAVVAPFSDASISL